MHRQFTLDRSPTLLLETAAWPFIFSEKKTSSPTVTRDTHCRTKERTFTPVNPAALITLKGYGGRFVKMDSVAGAMWSSLIVAARGAGIPAPYLLPMSGYRSLAKQEELWQVALAKNGYDEKKARKWVCKPSLTCPHLSGLAVDVWMGSAIKGGNADAQRKTKAYQWLVENAHRFGFSGYCPEPWHWEFNPGLISDTSTSNELSEWESGSPLDQLTPSELKAAKITSTFETGSAGSFGGLTGNFDGQGLSFGLMNFTIKAGSLIPLLKEFIDKHPQRYAAAFGPDAARFKEMVFATTPDPKKPKQRIRDVARQMDFVNTQMNALPRKSQRNMIVEPWKTYFARLERDVEFQRIQVKAVRRALDRARYWFTYFQFKTERGFAFMFDLVTSHGGAWLNAPKFKGKRRALLQKMLASKKANLGREHLTELEKMETIAHMIADVSLPEWREKARIRKLWFVRGQGKVHGKQWDIRKDFGITDNPPLFSSNNSKEFEALDYAGALRYA